MIHKMYSIRDAKSKFYHPPYYKPTHGEAERAFHELVNDGKSILSRYPADFDLYYLGEFDDASGKFDTKETPEHVLKAADLRTDNAVI